jgi:hypothetical protein
MLPQRRGIQVDHFPSLAFDHATILNYYALERLRN